MKASILMIVLFCVFSDLALSQTTEFSYQGSLKDGAVAATGNYDFEFALFDSLTGGIQQGSTLARNAVPVSTGAFSVKLDFGGQFPGTGRFLEIHVRPGGSGFFTVLAPRQQISNAPYAMRSLNAANADTAIAATNAANATNATNATMATNALQLGGVAANQYVVTTDPRMTDARTPTPGSANYVQNATAQQPANFNVSGDGTVGGTLSGNVVNATTEYDIISPSLGTPVRLMSIAGLGDTNTFVGRNAGLLNPSGNFNTFVGNGTGRTMSSGGNNSFFGSGAGDSDNNGSNNSFFGRNAGFSTTGSGNTFVGSLAGQSNFGGGNNTLIGSNADVGSNGLVFATAVGSGSVASFSNSIVLGRSGGQDAVSIPGNTFVAGSFGANSGNFNTSLNSNGAISANGSITATNGGPISVNVSGFPQITLGPFNAIFNGSVAIGTGGPVLDRFHLGSGFLRLDTLASTGSTTLCRNASHQISTCTLSGGGSVTLCWDFTNQALSVCSSSIRYKNNINKFTAGLDLIRRLRPVSFNWKQDGKPDMGLVAEEVADVEPLLVTHNDNGEVEGVKYDRVGVVLINAIKEQQGQIERQQKLIENQQKQIDALRKSVAVRLRPRRTVSKSRIR